MFLLGSVHSYDQYGMTVSTQAWQQCLALRLVDRRDTAITFTWDIKLQEMAMKPEWTSSK